MPASNISMSLRHLGKGTVIAALLAAAGLNPAWAGPQQGGQLVWALDRESNNLVATNTTAHLSGTIGPKIYDGLFRFDAKLEPVPQLAESWEVSADGLTYTFKLRPNVKWHDGEAFDSGDVAFSLLSSKENHPRGRVTFAKVTAIEAPDPLTAIVRLSEPTPYLLRALAVAETPIVPEHVLTGLDLSKPVPDDKLIGTGPFRFVEWERGSHVILDRNPSYWDNGKPYLDRVIVRIIPDPAARAAALEAGEIDLATVTQTDVDRFAKLPEFRVDEVTSRYLNRHFHIAFNLDNEILRDLRVRKAIAHVIDAQKILDLVYAGYGVLAATPISPALADFHNPKIKHYSYDPTLANQLLDEAGHPRGADGTRFKVRLTINPGNDPKSAVLVQEELRAIGIEADLALSDQGGYIKRVYTDRDFDLTLDTNGNTFDPTPGVQRIFSSKAFKIGVPFTNPSNYSNPEVDALLDQAASEPDPDKRRDLFYRFQEIIHEELPSIDTIDPVDVVVVRNSFHDLSSGAHGLYNSFADAWTDAK